MAGDPSQKNADHPAAPPAPPAAGGAGAALRAVDTTLPGETGQAPEGDPALVENTAQAVDAAVNQADRAERSDVGKSTGPAVAQQKRWPKLWFVVYLVAIAALAWTYPLIGSGYFNLPEEYAVPARRLATVLLVAALMRAAVTLGEVYLARSIHDAADRYDVLKVANLAAWLVIAFVALTQLFDRWYTAAASLGLVSLVLGLALQGPLSSFFAWIYILVRKPYRVGDRIQIEDMTGDVIQVSYLDTTLWEFGGPYLSTDHPSGRVIKLPNSSVLNKPVINYTWPLFPYRWDEVKFHVAYDSDLEFISGVMKQAVDEEIGHQMQERVGAYRRLLAQTPVDTLHVREHPAVLFRVSDNTWVEAIVRYLVHPREAGSVKTRLIRKLLAQLNAAPERVQFPRSNMR